MVMQHKEFPVYNLLRELQPHVYLKNDDFFESAICANNISWVLFTFKQPHSLVFQVSMHISRIGHLCRRYTENLIHGDCVFHWYLHTNRLKPFSQQLSIYVVSIGNISFTTKCCFKIVCMFALLMPKDASISLYVTSQLCSMSWSTFSRTTTVFG